MFPHEVPRIAVLIAVYDLAAGFWLGSWILGGLLEDGVTALFTGVCHFHQWLLQILRNVVGV